jgi:heme-degrading monooxygenase HmoA
MHILGIEHQIRDFNSWKAAFDRDPIGRQQSGVRGHRVLRPIDDPNYVMLDLEFESASEAEAFRDALQRDVWRSRQAASALVGSPQTRIIEAVENKEY